MNKDPDFASEKPKTQPKKVSDAIFYDCDGPYQTKTGAELYVGFVFPSEKIIDSPDRDNTAIPPRITLESFMETNFLEEELLLKHLKKENPNFSFDRFSADRLYFQPNMPVSDVPAGNEFHRIRRELILPLSGKIRIELEDVYKSQREVALTPGKGLILPPFIMHTLYIEEPASMIVRANTPFVVYQGKEKLLIPDTYPRETFRKLQKFYE